MRDATEGAGRAPAYLVVDLQRVLDASEHGKAARSALRAMVERTEPERAELRDRVDRAAQPAERRAALDALLEADQRRREEIDRRREALRAAVLGLVEAVVRQVAAERGAGLVLDRRAALAFDAGADVTDEILRRVDAARLPEARGAVKGRGARSG
jgi:Skp family chaperone for outer membrane proteins